MRLRPKLLGFLVLLSFWKDIIWSWSHRRRKLPRLGSILFIRSKIWRWYHSSNGFPPCEKRMKASMSTFSRKSKFLKVFISHILMTWPILCKTMSWTRSRRIKLRLMIQPSRTKISRKSKKNHQTVRKKLTVSPLYKMTQEVYHTSLLPTCIDNL